MADVASTKLITDIPIKEITKVCFYQITEQHIVALWRHFTAEFWIFSPRSQSADVTTSHSFLTELASLLLYDFCLWWLSKLRLLGCFNAGNGTLHTHTPFWQRHVFLGTSPTSFSLHGKVQRWPQSTPDFNFSFEQATQKANSLKSGWTFDMNDWAF